MPHVNDALSYIDNPATTTDELRRACQLLQLPTDGTVDVLRARLVDALRHSDPVRPVVCLNPGPLARHTGARGPALDRPTADEHAPVFTDEIALVPDAPDFAALLGEQLDTTRALAATFGETHASVRYQNDKWSVREVIGHLADCERVLSYRLLRALRRDSTRIESFDHVTYVTTSGVEHRRLRDVVDELVSVRAATIALVSSVDRDAFAFRLGVGQGTITGRALAYLIAGHERHHQQLLRERYLPCLPDLS